MNRKVTPAKGKLTWPNLRGGAVLAWRTVLYLLILSDFRSSFWKMAKHALKHGQIDGMFGAAFMGYHLIQFTREALRGDQNASYYSAKKRAAADGGRQAAAASRWRRKLNLLSSRRARRAEFIPTLIARSG